jgi:hypothetical protein
MGLEHGAEELLDTVAEEHRVAHLHHRGLEMQRQQHTLRLRIGDLGPVEGTQRAAAHHGGVQDLAGRQRQPLFQRAGGSVRTVEHDVDRAGLGHGHGALAAVEIPLRHVRHVGFRIGAPGAHPVRVQLGELLHGLCHTPVRVALAQHRIHGTAQHLGVAGTQGLGRRITALLRIVRQVVALAAQLGDGRPQLGHTGTDVGQFDDVGIRGLGQFTQLGKCIGNTLLRAQALRERGQDAAGQADVAGFHGHTRGLREGLDDGQQRTGGQGRGFVGDRVDDGLGHWGVLFVVWGSAAGRKGRQREGEFHRRFRGRRGYRQKTTGPARWATGPGP